MHFLLLSVMINYRKSILKGDSFMKYTGEHLREICFPLGGIGSGSVSLAGNGRLTDWEIFNRPSKGSLNGYSHFAVKAIKNGKPITRILNGDLKKDLVGQFSKCEFSGYGYGPASGTMCGYPHFRTVEFDGEFPFASLHFSDGDFPAAVTLTAFNPFIPGEADLSSIPAAFFEIELTNADSETLDYQVALAIGNPFVVSHNAAKTENGLHMLTLSHGGVPKDDIAYGDMTVATDAEAVYTQTYWYRGNWQDSITTYWNDFNSAQPLNERTYDTDGKYDHATLSTAVTLSPGESKRVRFVLSWNVPNRYNYWSEYKDESGNHITWKNYYATLYRDSSESAAFSLKRWDELYRRTLEFKNTLFGSTFPREVIDAAASNLSVLKSPTVLRLEDGSFYGWEGVHEGSGSCEGTCQHVWNYAYALCFLFPDLERSIRDLEYRYSTEPNGRMGFRLLLPVGRGVWNFRSCLDGQMGTVIKTYREWKLSGNTAWLRSHWENVKKVLEYAWSPENPDAWDADKDGVLEGRQHHTLDTELFGPSSWLEGMYLAALKAAAEMAAFLGEADKAKEYSNLFEKGRAWTKENLFNGRYFVQKVDLTDKSQAERYGATDFFWNEETGELKYQIGDGSSIDQMLGQWHADIVGLGEIFDTEQIDTALDEMMKNNFKPSMRSVANTWRVFSLNDEAGSVICVYPEGSGKPKIPIPYCEETMTGFEYALAGLMCAHGKTENGVKIAGAVRDRFNGQNRNPWNEIECGNNYARSMASFALIPIMSGFSFDLPHRYIGFKPYTTDGFTSIWSVDGAWGSIRVDKDSALLTVKEGSLCLEAFGVGCFDRVSELEVDGKPVEFTFENGVLRFAEQNGFGTLTVRR